MKQDAARPVLADPAGAAAGSSAWRLVRWFGDAGSHLRVRAHAQKARAMQRDPSRTRRGDKGMAGMGDCATGPAMSIVIWFAAAGLVSIHFRRSVGCIVDSAMVFGAAGPGPDSVRPDRHVTYPMPHGGRRRRRRREKRDQHQQSDENLTKRHDRLPIPAGGMCPAGFRVTRPDVSAHPQDRRQRRAGRPCRPR